MTHLTIKGKFNKSFVKDALLQVQLLWKLPQHVEEILVIDNPKYYRSIEDRVPKDIRTEFREIYQEDPTSMSLTYKDFDLILISVTTKEEQYLKTNKKAMIAVMAHEFMHLVQRRRGLSDAIRSDALIAFKRFAPKLKNIKKYKKADIDQLFAEIGRTANFALQDIYVHQEMIQEGFKNYLFEDYHNLYMHAHKNRVEGPIFDSKQKDNPNYLSEIHNALQFELNLLATLVTFIELARKGNTKARQLVRSLERYYESGISDIAIKLDPTIQYASTKFSWTSRFRQKYFRLIFEAVYNLLK